MPLYDLCVVGAGMIGSAAARHASKDPRVNVCLVGPSEPKTRTMEDDRHIFGSHYDEGRLTYTCGHDPVWRHLARESISRYREIEQKSGIPFFNEVGILMIGTENKDFMTQVAHASKDQNGTELSNTGLAEMFPYLKTAPDDIGVYQEANAGHISPRRLVAAQKLLARRHGCTVIDDVVCSVKREVQENGSYIMKVETDGGGQIYSKAVLLATGAFTLFRELLPDGVKPEQQLRGLTVALLEVDEQYNKTLKSMPPVFYKGAGHPDLHKFPGDTNYPVNFYMLPPITYPDGRTYIKLGYYHRDLRVFLESRDEVKQWFVHGNEQRAEDTAKFMVSLFKGLKPLSWHGDFCVMTETPSNLPYIVKIHAQLGVTIGGNSHAAKSSDEIGRIAASMMRDQWDSSIPRDVFKFRLASKIPNKPMGSKL